MFRLAVSVLLFVVPLAEADEVHPWSRLQQLIQSRPLPDGSLFLHRGLDPPFRSGSNFLIEGKEHIELIRLLDTCAAQVNSMTDPVERALLQRDLWGVFEILGRGQSLNQGLAAREARRVAMEKLALVIHLLELTDVQWRQLPDNYQNAVHSRQYATSFDAAHPEQPFLPPDLSQPDSAWVPVAGSEDRPAGIVHVEFTGGRAVFDVLLKLPDGREVTKDFLNRCTQSKQTLPLPTGSMAALIRRSLLINDRGELRQSTLTDSIQLRLIDGRDQRFYVFHMDRDGLKSSGLHAVDARQGDNYSFEAGPFFPTDPLDAQPPSRPDPAIPTLQTCTACHGTSVRTFGDKSLAGFKGAIITSVQKQSELTIQYKKQTRTWKQYQSLRVSK